MKIPKIGNFIARGKKYPVLLAIATASFLNACESADKQKGFMSPTEVDDYEAYGTLPKDIQNYQDNKKTTAVLFLLAVLGVGGVVCIIQERKNSKEKTQR